MTNGIFSGGGANDNTPKTQASPPAWMLNMFAIKKPSARFLVDPDETKIEMEFDYNSGVVTFKQAGVVVNEFKFVVV